MIFNRFPVRRGIERLKSEMRTDIESRINEAEVCRSMGLYDDSLDIYESILSIVGPQDAHVQATIQKRINLLKNEIGDQKEAQPDGSERQRS